MGREKLGLIATDTLRLPMVPLSGAACPVVEQALKTRVCCNLGRVDGLFSKKSTVATIVGLSTVMLLAGCSNDQRYKRRSAGMNLICRRLSCRIYARRRG